MSDLHLIGTELDDILTGGDGNDWLEGLGGDDTLSGGFGNNFLDGGEGSDTVDYTAHYNGYVGVFVDLGAGYASFLDVVLVDGTPTPIPYTDTLVSIENAEGSDFDDTLIGNSEANRLFGWGGIDYLDGGAGNDVLDGGSGIDHLDGGDGDDTFLIALGSDHDGWSGETLAGGDGQDVVRFTSTTSGDMLFLSSMMSGVETIVIGDAAGDTSGTTSLNVNARLLTGGSGVTIIGNDGANFLGGTYWSDSLFGGGGDDVIAAGGDDFYDGGAGSDTVLYNGLNTSLFVDLEAGYATFLGVFWLNGEQIVLGEYTDTLVDIENVEGGDEGDQVFGSSAANRLSGLGGHDFLSGLDGDDYLDGGVGDDTFDSGAGNNFVDGGAGSDTVRYNGFVGLFVDLGAGYANFLELRVVDGQLTPIPYTDTLVSIENAEGSDFDDTLLGSAADNRLSGLGGADYLVGGAGNDVLDGGEGADHLDGGDGDDTFVLSSGWDHYLHSETIAGGAGYDVIHFTSTTAGDQLTLSEHVSGVESIVVGGGAGDTTALHVNARFMLGNGVTIIGNDGANFLNATARDDSLFGGGGDDSMFAGSGNNLYDGGAGSDTVHYIGLIAPLFADLEAGYATFTETFWSGGELFVYETIDTLIDIENIESGDGDDQVFGNSAANRLAGGFGNDHLDGRGGQDTMLGGVGDDTYVVDDSGDWVTENAGEGIDTVRSSVSIFLWDNVENAILVGEGVLGITGNDLDNVLTGNDDNNSLAGRGGNDTLIGGGGDDYLVDTGGGNDRLVGGEGNDSMLGLEGDDVYEAGIGNDWIYDNGGDDELRMAAGIDPDHVERILEPSGNHLILRIAGTTESVTLYNWFLDPSFRIERVVFDDGTVWTPEETQAPAYNLGTPGDDVLVGTAASEYFNAFSGSDTVLGGDGDDYYELEGGGQDVVQDTSGYDVIRWTGVSSQEVETIRESGSDDLVLRVANTADTLTLSGWFADPANQVELIRFDDGNVLEPWSASMLWRKGGPGDDFMQGNEYSEALQGRGGNDVMIGAGGDDVLIGDSGDDVYYVGIGHDWVNEFTGDDAVHFVGVTPDQVSRIREADSFRLKLLVADSPDKSVTLTNQFFSPIFEVERVIFDDGTVWGLTELADLRYLGTGGNDAFSGSEWSERFESYGGSDILWGGTGGDDVYILQAGGEDRITDTNGDDEVRWQGVSATEVLRVRSGNDLVLEVADTGGTLTLVSWFVGAERQVERVLFDDGTVWDAVAVQSPQVANPLDDQAAAEDAPFSFVVPADAFHDVGIGYGDSLAYSARLAGGAALPSWLSFDAATRTFSGTPLNQHVGALSIEVTATDESGRSASDTFDLAVANTNDAPTLANPIADRSVQDSVTFSFSVPANTFADVDANDTFVWSALRADGGMLPSWLSFNAATRTFSGTPNAASIGNLDVAVTATDSAGAPVSDVFRITVAQAPDQTLNGNSGNNTLTGGSGNDTLNGMGGADNMTGLLGNDSYFVDNGGDQVNEAANGGIDTVNSSINYTLGNNVENLTLTGSSNRSGTGNTLNNTLVGNSGNNVLNGKAGNDILNGGAGTDTFVFDQLPGAANADLIQGFTSSDRIQLDNAVMAALGGTGSLSASRFWSSTTGQAHDSSDRVIYNTSTGQLWYDADGTGGTAAQLIATLENDPTLTASQISVI